MLPQRKPALLNMELDHDIIIDSYGVQVGKILGVYMCMVHATSPTR